MQAVSLCEYFTSPELGEIHKGLSSIQSWNSADSLVFYGKGGEVAANHLEEQAVSVLSLHLLRLLLVYINTLVIQGVLAAPAWSGRPTDEDMRGLTPLLYGHVTPYGRFDLDMNKRLPLSGVTRSG